MIQEAAQGRLALNVRFHRRCGGVIKAQRNNITDSLVRAASIVIGLDDGERAAEVGLTEENQAIERRPEFLYMTFRERIAKRRMRGRSENAKRVGFQDPVQGHRDFSALKLPPTFSLREKPPREMGT